MLCLVRFKACKRCGGDVSLECDIYGIYAECIQCGATWYQKVPKLRYANKEGISADAKETAVKVIPGNQE